MNVYVLEVAQQLARRDIAVDLFTRTTCAAQSPVVEVVSGTAAPPRGRPYEGLSKEDLPGQLCAFAVGMMRVAAHAPPGYYDLVHSHYWPRGRSGWLAADRWGAPPGPHHAHDGAGEEPAPRGR